MKLVAFLLCALCASVAEAQFGFHAPPDGRSVGVADWKTSLVGYWPLDSLNQGKAVDASGNGNAGASSGVVLGSGIISASGVFSNQSLSLIDTGVSISSKNNAAYSICVWGNVLTTNALNGAALGDQNASDNNSSIELFIYNAGKFWARGYFGGTQRTITAGNPQTNVWVHISIVYTGSQLQLWTNGALCVSSNISGTISSPTTLKIGRRGLQNVSNYYGLTGLEDDVRIYNRALTTNEISAIYRWGWGTHQGTPTHP